MRHIITFFMFITFELSLGEFKKEIRSVDNRPKLFSPTSETSSHYEAITSRSIQDYPDNASRMQSEELFEYDSVEYEYPSRNDTEPKNDTLYRNEDKNFTSWDIKDISHKPNILVINGDQVKGDEAPPESDQHLDRRNHTFEEIMSNLKLIEENPNERRNRVSKSIFKRFLLSLAERNSTLATHILLADADPVHDIKNNSFLHYAVINTNIPLVFSILGRNASWINKQNVFGETPIFLAASKNDTIMFKILLDNGADPYISNDDGLTSLHLAVEKDNSEMVQYIVSRNKTGINMQDRKRETALANAVKENNDFLCMILLENGADPYITDENGQTCLHLSVGNRNLNIGRSILEANINGIDMRDNDGNTALLLATISEQTALVKLLLNHGADPNISKLLLSVIHLTVSLSNLELLITILNNSEAHLNIQDKDGNTPLHYAAMTNLPRLAKALLMYGADTTIINNDGFLPLHLSSLYGSLEISVALLNADNSTLDLQGSDGSTALHLAILHGQTEVVTYYLESGSNQFIMNGLGYTPFHLAVKAKSMSYLANINTLLEFGADPYIQDFEGCTSLHVAAKAGSTEIIKNILNRTNEGINLRNFISYTALSSAIFYNKMAVAEILLENGADPYVCDLYGRTSLHIAIIQGNYKIVHGIIFKNKTGVNLTDINGMSALLYAAFYPWIYEFLDRFPMDEMHFYAFKEEEPVFLPYYMTRYRRPPRRKYRFPLMPHDILRGIFYTFTNIVINNDISIYFEELFSLRKTEKMEETSEHRSGFYNSSVSCEGFKKNNGFKSIFTYSEAVVSLLISNDADLNVSDRNGCTIFHAAAQSGCIQIFKYLKNITNISDLMTKNDKGETPLHIAVRNRKFNVCKYLLDHNVDPYVRDLNGQTALHVASEIQSLHITELIINTSKNGINLKDNDGSTALSLAIHRGRQTLQVCELLLKNGANPYVADNDGLSSLHVAAMETSYQTDYIINTKRRPRPLDYSNIGFGDDVFDKELCFRSSESYEPIGLNAESIVEVILKYNSTGINLRNSDGYTALFYASVDMYLFFYRKVLVLKGNGGSILYKNIEDLKVLLKYGADPFVKDNEGHTALHAAVSTYNIRVVRTILAFSKKGINMQDIYGLTALHFAVLTSEEMVTELVRNGVDPNISEKFYGWTPLHIACTLENINIANLLLSYSKTDVNLSNEEGKSALHIVHNAKLARFLIRKGADVWKKDVHGWTFLHYSAYYGRTNFLSMIEFSNRSTINDPNFFNDTALSIATGRNNLLFVKSLLNKGADPNLSNDYLETSLITAARVRNYFTFKAIFYKGGNPLKYNVFGYSAIHFVSVNQLVPYVNTKVMRLILSKYKKGFDQPDIYGRVPLHYVVSSEQNHLMAFLIRQGANPLVADIFGNNVMHVAAISSSRLEMILLISRLKKILNNNHLKEFVNKRNVLDFTPLQCSAAYANKNSFFQLWNIGANANMSGYPIILYAALGGDVVIMDFILKSLDINVNDKTITGFTPVMVAAARGNTEVFYFLLKKGARLEDVSYYGHTMLHFAAAGGDLEILSALLNTTGIDINCRDVEGYTPLMIAAFHDNLDAVTFLLNNSADPLIKNINEEDVLRIAAKTGQSVLTSSLFNFTQNTDTLLGILLARKDSSFDEKILFDLVERSSLQKYPIFLAAATSDKESLVQMLVSQHKVRRHSFPNLFKEVMRDFDTFIGHSLQNEVISPTFEVRLSPLEIALMFGGDLEVVKLLNQITGIDKSIESNYKELTWTLFDYAMFAQKKYNNKSVAKVLLYIMSKCKSSFNQRTNKYGWTVAHKVAWIGNTYVMRFFKYYNVDFDRVDDFGRTSLHIAALKGHSQLVESILHTSNRSINIRDNHGFTPLLLCQVYNNRKLSKPLSTLLTDTPPPEHFSLVKISHFVPKIWNLLKHEYIHITVLLFSHGADMDVQDNKFGWTALHWAVVAGDLQVVQVLVSLGANVNIPSWTGDTSLHLARKWMRRDIYQYLKSINGVW